MMRLVAAARQRVGAAILVLAAAATAGAAGAAGATSVTLAAVVAGGAVLIGLVMRRPVACAVIALLGVFASWRLGSTALAAGSKPGVSYSDAVLTAATLLSLPALLGTKELRRLRVAGWGVAIYLVCLLPTVLLNSSQSGYLEWLHRLVLVGGALLVGAWLAGEGKTRLALRWLALLACVLAAMTVLGAALHGWLHSAPLGLNKNFVGEQLAAVLVVVFIAREHIAVPTAWWATALGIIGAGEIASHSRGGALAAAVGLLLAFVLTGRLHKRGTKALAVLAGAGLAVFIYVSVQGQLNQSTYVVNNSSIGVRLNVERVTRSIWRTSPIDGVGLKYFNTAQAGFFVSAADNDIDNELAESGVIGLAGFVVLQGAVFRAGVRRGRREQLVAAGFGAAFGLLAHGMVDIYWTAGVVALPFIVLGMGLAQEPSDQLSKMVADDRSNGHIGTSSADAGPHPRARDESAQVA